MHKVVHLLNNKKKFITKIKVIFSNFMFIELATLAWYYLLAFFNVLELAWRNILETTQFKKKLCREILRCLQNFLFTVYNFESNFLRE